MTPTPTNWDAVIRRLGRIAGVNSDDVDRVAAAILALHHRNCRKRIYDPASSPCTCEAEYDRDEAEARLSNEASR